MRKARTVIFTSPGGMFSHKTCWTLLTRSKPLAVPILPCRSSPFDALTMRSRSFCRLAPGASLQTSVILSVRAADAVPTPDVAFLRFFAVFLRFATLTLPPRSTFLQVGIPIGAGDDHGPREIDAPPARNVVGRRADLGWRVLTRERHRAVDQKRLDQRRARLCHAVLEQGLAQHCAAACHQRR